MGEQAAPLRRQNRVLCERFSYACALALFTLALPLRAEPAAETAPKEEPQPIAPTEGPRPIAPSGDAPTKDEPAKTEPSGSTTAGKEQIRCPKEECLEIRFNPKTTHERLAEALDKRTGMILVDFEGWALPFGDEQLTELNRYIHGVAERDGRVLLEPVYIGTRETFKIPLVHDVISTGYDVASRAYSLWKYRGTGNYHVKVLYHPTKRHVLFVYFIHKNFGDVCVTLRSRCDVVEYTDSETFDLALSKQLERAIREGKEVRVVFTGKRPILPEAGLSVRALTDASDSLRIYKWMAASGEVRRRSMVRQRMIGINAVTSAIDLGLKAYDLVKAYLMYKPARSMKAEVQTGPVDGGSEVQLIIFTPTKTKESSSCIF